MADEGDANGEEGFVDIGALVVAATSSCVCTCVDLDTSLLSTECLHRTPDSPGVKRQYSGTLGKIGNCQIGVSVHAVGANGKVPLGWALYLPEEWCDDPERRRKAKIPPEIRFKTKSVLEKEPIEQAGGWDITRAPVLGDGGVWREHAVAWRARRCWFSVHLLGRQNRKRVRAVHSVLPARACREDRPGPDTAASRSQTRASAKLIARQAPEQFQTITFRDGPDGKPVTSRFCVLRVLALKCWENGAEQEPIEEWLICEWPEDHEHPTDYWISNLPADTPPERLARLRWKIELDYKQLKGQLGLDH